MHGASHADVRSLGELTEDRFVTAGTAILDTAMRRIVGNLSVSYVTHVSLGTEGTILLHNVVPKQRLAEAMGTHAIPSALVVGDMSLLGVEASEEINRFITLAPRGSVIYVDERKPSGKGRYTRVDTGVFGDVPPPLVNEFGRLATPDDLLIRGVAGWLARNAPNALNRLKIGGFTMPDGTQTVSGSDIVRAIAANISVTPLVTYVIAESQ